VKAQDAADRQREARAAENRLTCYRDGRSAGIAGRIRVVRGGVEPPTHGFSVRQQTPENTGKTQVSDAAGADAGAVETKTAQFPPDLQALIDAWPTLPDAIRAGILAMVRAARTGRP
jgi:hypothetical protein